jgi:hypothetical protein
MSNELAPGPPPGFREAVLDFKRAMAEVEEITFAEKAARLPRLTIEESLAIFGGLYRTAMILQRDRTPHPDVEARRIADTVAFRELMARAAGRHP